MMSVEEHKQALKDWYINLNKSEELPVYYCCKKVHDEIDRIIKDQYCLPDEDDE